MTAFATMLSAGGQCAKRRQQRVILTMFALNEAHERTKTMLRCLRDDPCAVPNCLY